MQSRGSPMCGKGLGMRRGLIGVRKPKLSFLDHRVAGWYFPWIMKGLVPTTSPLETKMRQAKGAGFDGIGTSWWDLVSFYQERGDLSQLKAQCNLLRQNRTGLSACSGLRTRLHGGPFRNG